MCWSGGGRLQLYSTSWGGRLQWQCWKTGLTLRTPPRRSLHGGPQPAHPPRPSAPAAMTTGPGTRTTSRTRCGCTGPSSGLRTSTPIGRTGRRGSGARGHSTAAGSTGRSMSHRGQSNIKLIIYNPFHRNGLSSFSKTQGNISRV